MCDLYNLASSSKNFTWLVHKGKGASFGTGPREDHTTRSPSGWYAYVDASSPASENDTADLLTTVVSNPSGFCVSFWYHMYGTHVGALNVYEVVRNVFLCFLEFFTIGSIAITFVGL